MYTLVKSYITNEDSICIHSSSHTLLTRSPHVHTRQVMHYGRGLHIHSSCHALRTRTPHVYTRQVMHEDTKQKRPRRVSRATSFYILRANSATTSDTTTTTLLAITVMISSTQVTPVQRHGSSWRSFSGPALSTMSINIEGYSQAKAEIVSTIAHGYDIVCMQETHIGHEHCRPSTYGMKLIAEIRHRNMVPPCMLSQP